MNKANGISAILILALLAFTGFSRRGLTPSDDEIEYQGELIKLSKAFSSYEDYKDEPDNLAATELKRVEKLVSEAPISRSFASSSEIVHAVFEIKFPGYGLSCRNGISATKGASLDFYSIEIPAAAQDRHLVFRCGNGKYELLDDFISPQLPGITKVREEGDLLIYLGPDGQTIVKRTPIQHR